MIWGQAANLWRERDRANGPDQVITWGCNKLAPLILKVHLCMPSHLPAAAVPALACLSQEAFVHPVGSPPTGQPFLDLV